MQLDIEVSPPAKASDLQLVAKQIVRNDFNMLLEI